MSFLLLFTLFLVLAAEFVNGWTDAPNAIATVVATRVMPPMLAVVWATVLNFAGALVGVEVAKTIGKGIVTTESVTLLALAAAMISIVVWSSVAARYGLPTSESHALIAGLAGAALAVAGPSALLLEGWKQVFKGLLFSTFLGFFGGVAVMGLIYTIFRKTSREKVNRSSRIFQIISSGLMAFSHGTNDGQKFMGVFALALVIGGVHSEFYIPLWVKAVAALTMGVGTAFGGWKIIRTMGVRMIRLEPVQGFASEVAASSIIQLASAQGIPLSTTHTINTAIMGVGAAKRFSAVRWPVAAQVVKAWILTFPICGLISYIMTKLLMLVA